MPIVPIKFKRLGLRLGVAQRSYFDGGDCIYINSDTVFGKWWDETLNDTLPHEVCHHVAPIIYNRYFHGPDKNRGWGHGRAWKECMIMVGLPPKTCADISDEDSAKLALRTVRRDFGYTCNCPGKVYFLTSILHNRSQRGSHRKCIKCNTRLTFAGVKKN